MVEKEPLLLFTVETLGFWKAPVAPMLQLSQDHVQGEPLLLPIQIINVRHLSPMMMISDPLV